jgi:hypothetical protein
MRYKRCYSGTKLRKTNISHLLTLDFKISQPKHGIHFVLVILYNRTPATVNLYVKYLTDLAFSIYLLSRYTCENESESVRDKHIVIS